MGKLDDWHKANAGKPKPDGWYDRHPSPEYRNQMEYIKKMYQSEFGSDATDKFDTDALEKMKAYCDAESVDRWDIARGSGKSAVQMAYKQLLAEREHKLKMAGMEKHFQNKAADFFKEQYTSTFTPWPEDEELDHRKPEEKVMANKFLPFIVEKSTPVHIYNTLLQRSKGMNINLVTSIFYMVLDKGIVELREYVKSLPDGISVSQMYEEMVGKYPHYQIYDDELDTFLRLAVYLQSHDWAEISEDLTKDFDSKDIMAFLFVAYKTKTLGDYTTLNISAYVEGRDEVLENIPAHIVFSDKGEEVQFTDAEDLKTFILYHALVKSLNNDPLPGDIKAVFVEEKERDTAF